MFRLKGIRIPQNKNTALSVPQKIPCPSVVTIPLSMHIGKSATPVVSVGDYVKVGQLIADTDTDISSKIHSSVSGTVKRLEDIILSNEMKTQAFIIESDGNMTLSEEISQPTVNDYRSFIEAVKNSGVVGLGGAGFPTHVKLDIKEKGNLKTVIINGAECEPYITSDTRTMIDKSDLIEEGCILLNKYLNANDIVIAIEDSNVECIKRMNDISRKLKYVSTKKLHSVYPQGAEKVLIYNVCGIEVPKGKLPIHSGVLVINVTTLATIAQYVKTGIPLIEKCITVDGSAVKKPRNLIVPIGTSIKYILEECVELKSQPYKILYGGPMMGISVYSSELPILKNTNAIIALDEKESQVPEETACIRCGRCIRQCPFGLDPPAFATACALQNFDELEALAVNLCMECGSCAYVCPAKKKLVQKHKMAKDLLNKYKKQKNKGG